MSRAVTSYSKGEIARAGKILVDQDTAFEDRSRAMDVMSNWRAAQAYPMRALLMMLRNKASDIDPDSVVVQRPKRAPSIIGKLLERAELCEHFADEVDGDRSKRDREANRELHGTSAIAFRPRSGHSRSSTRTILRSLNSSKIRMSATESACNRLHPPRRPNHDRQIVRVTPGTNRATGHWPRRLYLDRHGHRSR